MKTIIKLVIFILSAIGLGALLRDFFGNTGLSPVKEYIRPEDDFKINK